MPGVELLYPFLVSYGVLNTAINAYRIGFELHGMVPVYFVDEVVDARLYAKG